MATDSETLEPIQRVEFVGADGLKIVGDEGGPPDGPLVLLSHGGGQTRHSWAGTAVMLAQAGYHVRSIDLRGHGESQWAPNGDYALETHARDLRAVAEAGGAAPVTLIGASLGGLASLVCGAGLPAGRLKALVLVDVATRVREEGAKRIMGFMNRHAGGFDTLDAAADAIAEYRPERRRPRDHAGLAKNLRPRDGGGYRWHWDPAILLRHIPGQSPIPVDVLDAAARQITAPTLLVRGLRSDVVGDDSVEVLNAQIPHLEVADVSDAGHMVVGDNNQVFAAKVQAFLKKVHGR